MNTYVPIFRGLDARGGRKLRTDTHTHTHTQTHGTTTVTKFISDWPTGAYRIQQQNIQGSTQIAPLAVTSGGEQISESSNKLRYGHLRHDGIRSKHHHPGTTTEFHWPLFLISSHIGVGWGYGQNVHNIQVI